MPQFNVTATLAGTTDDYLRRVAIQDFILAPLAPYRVTLPTADQTDNCDSQCIAIRLHWNIEYTIVLPDLFNTTAILPTYSPTWESEFDPNHAWTTLKVNNATTVQMEFSYSGTTDTFALEDCQIYGYPFLALQICMKAGNEANRLIAGISLIEIANR